MTRSPGADRRGTDQHAVAIHVGALLVEAHDHDHGPRFDRIAHPEKLALAKLIDRRVDRHRGLGSPEGDGVGERGRLERQSAEREYSAEKRDPGHAVWSSCTYIVS